jgi:hypothetical protein
LNKIVNGNSGFFEDMVNRGLISTSSSWLRKAIEQKHNHLTIGVANSRILVYDSFDRKILTLSNSN